ncbi:MAG: hypothetical protein C0453_00985 [Comamonadaceae bacterium]|nr:hypothetical protein [Comamonadaceae bacterium]
MTSESLLIHRARGVVFDLDGTLVDTLEDLGEALDSALLENGLPRAARDVLLSHLHLGLAATALAVLHALGVSKDRHEKVVGAYLKHYEARSHRRSRLYPGVEPLLDACRQRGQSLAVCTNKSHSDAVALLKLLGVADRFSVIVGIDTCGAAKPDPRPLLCTLERMACPVHKALFIGDSLVDAECASRSGVEFLLHAGGFGASDVLNQWPASRRFLNYAELVATSEAAPCSGLPASAC